MNHYTQINYVERAQIFELKKLGYSNVRIAQSLRRHKSNIGREIRRNGDAIGYWYPPQAQQAAEKRKARHGYKINRIPALKAYMVEKLKMYWSPNAIAGRWSKDNPDQSIQAEAI